MKTRENEENVDKTETDYQTTRLTMKGLARVTGRYLCKALNSLGESNNDDEANVILMVNELSPQGANGSELIRSSLDDPVDGDKFHLSCGVSLFNFTKELTWLYTDSKGKKQNQLPEGVKKSFPARNYSYVEELHWPVIRKSDAGSYTCRAKRTNSNLPVEKTVSFQVRGLFFFLNYFELLLLNEFC